MQPILPQAPILLVAEAPGEQEERAGYPLVGPSGRELLSMLRDAGFPLRAAKYTSELRDIWLNQKQIALTNVFHERPPNNDLAAWAIPRKDAQKMNGAGFPLIPAQKGVVDPVRSMPAIVRLWEEIEQVNPNVILCVGNTPLAALTGTTGIAKLRGALHQARGRKILATYHPAAVLRNYELRPAVVADLIKAKREADFPELRLLDRRLFMEPTRSDLVQWTEHLLAAPILAFDIETKARQITCIGFASSATEAYVFPFWNLDNTNYWEDPEDEVFCLECVRRIMQGPGRKIAHNGLYDTQYLFKYGIYPKNFLEDTMLLHHSLYPALPKALGFIGSIYCTEVAWKAWRSRGSETEELKREA